MALDGYAGSIKHVEVEKKRMSEGGGGIETD